MNRLIPIWIAFLGAFGALWSGNSASATVRVEEVTLSLYNKPVTGFRVVLDRSQSFVTRQLMDHVAEYENAQPFQYERTLIYENIRYAPVTDDRDVSLYFLMRSLQGQFTELTYVVMYDYKRSVSSRQFPQLAQNLQIDLARLVRSITGDIMESDRATYDDATLTELAAGGTVPTPEGNADPAVEHFQEEEVENAGVLIRRDPFEPVSKPSGITTQIAPEDDSTVVRLKNRVRQLEKREAELIAAEKRARSEQDRLRQRQDLLLAKAKQNKSLRDSIVLLNQRVEDMLGQYYVADDISVSNETAERLFELEKIQEQNERTIAQLKRDNDSLRRAATQMRNQLASLSDSRRSQVARLNDLEEENTNTAQEIADLRARNAVLETAAGSNAGLDSILVVLEASRTRTQDLQTQLAAEGEAIAQLRKDNDYLTGKKLQLEDRIGELESVNQDLYAQLERSVPGKVIIEEAGNADTDSLVRLLNDSRTARNVLQADLTATEAEQQRLGQQLATLKQENQRLSTQVDELENEVSGRRSAPLLPPKSNASALRDSLKLAESRLQRVQAQAAENARLRSELEQQQADLKARTQRVRTLQAELDDREKSLKTAEMRSREMNQQLRSTQRELRATQQERDKKQADLETLVERNQQLERRATDLRALAGQSDAKVQTVLDSLDQMQRVQGDLRNDIRQRDRQIRRKIEQQDSLAQEINRGQNIRNDLRRQVDQLEARVDSLSRNTLPADNQQQFIREQWTKLQEWEKELKARDQRMSDQQKLMDQRQTFLDQQQKDLTERENRLTDLEAREEQIRLREQELNAREGTAGIIVRTDQIEIRRINEFGETVPVFVAATPLRYKLAQKQVVAYMLSRNEILDEQFPDILYRAVMFPDLDLQPVEFRVRIASEGSGTLLKFSFRLADGGYLGEGSSRKVLEKAKQLISNLLRYRSQG
ncbi:MAG: hypothetical protein AAF998_23595 [Bacteroidota bacterium]